MSAADTEIPPVERLIELALFAPLAIGASVVQRTPAAVRQARQDLVTARFLGEMAVNEGIRRLRSDGEQRRPPRPTAARVSTPPVVEPDPEPIASTTAGDPAELALPDYDHLPAVDIVAKLPALTEEQRDDVEAYEREHRRRRTVLGKIEQLRA